MKLSGKDRQCNLPCSIYFDVMSSIASLSVPHLRLFRLRAPPCISAVQINPNAEELRSEEAHRPCVPGTARQLSCQPALALTRIVVREQMCSARLPVIRKPRAQFQTYMRITLNVANVSRFHPMLCHEPELTSDMSIAHWRAPWLPRLPSFGFEQRISGQRQTRRKRKFDRRVEQIFLKGVDNLMFHLSRGIGRVILTALLAVLRVKSLAQNEFNLVNNAEYC